MNFCNVRAILGKLVLYQGDIGEQNSKHDIKSLIFDNRIVK